ncbi:MAG: hypothetical protein D6754_08040, partial [Alphaproteobacteria bacterium]
LCAARNASRDRCQQNETETDQQPDIQPDILHVVLRTQRGEDVSAGKHRKLQGSEQKRAASGSGDKGKQCENAVMRPLRNSGATGYPRRDAFSANLYCARIR